MSTYLIINLVIIIGPLALAWLPAFKFYRYWRAWLTAIVMVGTFFVFWDALFTLRGAWSFNPLHVAGRRLFFLPLEEILFFITVPYSCLFLYEGLIGAFKDKPVLYSRYFFFLLAVISSAEAWFVWPQEYSAVVLLVLAGVMILGATIWAELFRSGLYWLWLALGMLLFLAFNYYLTSLPVVLYSPRAIANVRLATIPVEDFLYNFSLLTLYLGTYLWAKKKLPKK
jgi:lycopene cyclase domain-containing protein